MEEREAGKPSIRPNGYEQFWKSTLYCKEEEQKVSKGFERPSDRRSDLLESWARDTEREMRAC